MADKQKNKRKDKRNNDDDRFMNILVPPGTEGGSDLAFWGIEALDNPDIGLFRESKWLKEKRAREAAARQQAEEQEQKVYREEEHPGASDGKCTDKTGSDAGKDRKPEEEAPAAEAEKEDKLSKYSPEVRALAAKILDRARSEDPETTKMLKEISGELGGEMAGLEFRIKGEESLCRKITNEAVEDGISADESAAKVTDALRYTVTYEPDQLVDKSKAMQAKLKEKGFVKYDDKWRNYFGPGGIYHGYNTVMWNPDTGQKFELQYHTPESFHIKHNIVYPMYVQWQTLIANNPQNAALSKEMTAAVKFLYAIKADSNPQSKTYEQPVSLHRRTQEWSIVERYDIETGKWLHNPNLTRATGMGGDEDYQEIAESEVDSMIAAIKKRRQAYDRD